MFSPRCSTQPWNCERSRALDGQKQRPQALEVIGRRYVIARLTECGVDLGGGKDVNQRKRCDDETQALNLRLQAPHTRQVNA